jgi:hypothetical protein
MPKEELSAITKIEILQGLSLGKEELSRVCSAHSGRLLQECRRLVEDIIIDYLKHDRENKLTRGELERFWPDVKKYYSAQGCNEERESCLAENCFSRNPKCFQRKLLGQIEAMYDYFSPLQKELAVQTGEN